MRHRSCFQRRYRRLRMQFGLRWCIVTISCLSVLFALRQFLLAAVVVCTLVLTLLVDWMAARVAARSSLLRTRKAETVGRFWHRGEDQANAWVAIGPLHVALYYLAYALVWHQIMVLAGSSFWDYESPIGLSLGALDHLVNATFIAYLLVVLWGMVLPATRQSPTATAATIVVLLALAGMQIMIALVPRF